METGGSGGQDEGCSAAGTPAQGRLSAAAPLAVLVATGALPWRR